MPRSFNDAFLKLIETHIFDLDHATLTLAQLEKMGRYIDERLVDEINSASEQFPGYTLRLNHVDLSLSERNRPVLSGPVNEHTTAAHFSFPDVNLSHFADRSYEQIDLQPTEHEKNYLRQQHHLEAILCNFLLKKNIWHKLSLGELFFSREDRRQRLTNDFYNQFFQEFATKSGVLKELTILLYQVTEKESMAQFLEANLQLEKLNLSVHYHDQEFLPFLFSKVVDHPGLKLLDVSNIPFDAADYEALSAFLDKNYRVSILLPKLSPISHLPAKYMAIRKRASKPPAQRFIEERLSQAQLLAETLHAFWQQNHEHFAIFISPEKTLQALSFEDECQRLPRIYKTHANYITRYSDIQLDLQRVLAEKDGKTVGYYLLEKALEIQDANKLQCLLDAGANILERSENGYFLLNPLQSELIGSLDEDCQKVMADHFKKNLSVLVPGAESLTEFNSLYLALTEIKTHLSNYLDKLQQRMGWNTFLKFITGISFRLEERKKEWEHAFKGLFVTVDQSTHGKTSLGHEDLGIIFNWVNDLRKQTREARRGWLGRSELNDKLEALGDKLDAAIHVGMKEIQAKIDKKAEEQAAKVRALEAKNQAQAAENQELKQNIQAQAAKNQELKQNIQAQAAKNQELEEKFERQEEKFERQEEKFERQEAKNKQLEEMISQLMQNMEKNFPVVNQSVETEEVGNAAESGPRFFKP